MALETIAAGTKASVLFAGGIVLIFASAIGWKLAIPGIMGFGSAFSFSFSTLLFITNTLEPVFHGVGDLIGAIPFVGGVSVFLEDIPSLAAAIANMSFQQFPFEERMKVGALLGIAMLDLPLLLSRKKFSQMEGSKKLIVILLGAGLTAIAFLIILFKLSTILGSIYPSLELMQGPIKNTIMPIALITNLAITLVMFLWTWWGIIMTDVSEGFFNKIKANFSQVLSASLALFIVSDVCGTLLVNLVAKGVITG